MGVRSKVLGDGDVAYYVRWVDAHGKRMELKVGTKASGWSEKRASLKRAELMHTPTQGLATLAQVYPIFLSAKGQQVRFKTIHIYTHYCDMIIEKLGDVPINKLTPLMIESFLQEFQHKSARLRALLYMLLKAGLKLAKSHFRVDNVGVMENIQPPKIDDKRERFLSVEEIARLKEAIKGDLELELFVALSLSTGARINGVCTIKKMDIDLDTQSVRLKDFKTNSHYVGFLNAECMELLRTHLEGLENQQGVFKAGLFIACAPNCLNSLGCCLTPLLRPAHSKWWYIPCATPSLAIWLSRARPYISFLNCSITATLSRQCATRISCLAVGKSMCWGCGVKKSCQTLEAAGGLGDGWEE